MKTMLLFSLLLGAFEALASVSYKEAYYPESVIDTFHDASASSEEITEKIFALSEKVQRKNINYDQARKIMFGELFLEEKILGHYAVKDVYCNLTIDQSAGVGPGKIPNPNYLNCEHTWPQSKFSKQFPAELQKADLHHLFPSDPKANSTRNNFPFAEVEGKGTHANCLDSKIGNAHATSIRSFEPPTEHRGNVARALYYFSTRYKMNLDPLQAKYLKKWNIEDPVDEDELARNDKIMQHQGNRNPFIDYPELIDRI